MWQQRIKNWAVPALSIILCIAAWMDTAAYRRAMQQLGDGVQVAELKPVVNEISADIDRLMECNHLRVDPKTGDQAETPAAGAAFHDCLLATMPKTTTFAGAVVSGSLAASWLDGHPDDESFRKAALSAIVGGRADLVRQMPYFNHLQQIAEAHDKSFFLKLVHGRQDTTNLFASYADKLDLAELGILEPAAVRRQFMWRVETTTRHTNAAGSLSAAPTTTM